MPQKTLHESHFLIPLCRDKEISDGEIHTTRNWRWHERELLKHFEGWTKAPGQFTGQWKSSKTGQPINDILVQYVVAVPKKRLTVLRVILQRACVRFGQQCIYLSIGGIVEFIEPEL